MNTEKKLISVMVPVYNVAPYITNCLESLIHQTYTNLEIILVDDGSTDNSLEICQEYAKKDKRIKVIHKENGGLSTARNAGLDVATGDYYSFVDSDDYISTRFYEIMLNVALEHSADIVECDYNKIPFEDVTPENKENFLDIKENRQVSIINNEESLLELFSDDLHLYIKTVVSWSKLYKKETYNNIRFPVGKLNEDEFTTYRVLYNCKSIATIDDVLYGYIKRPNSIMSATLSLKRLDVLDAFDGCIEFFHSHALYELEYRARARFLENTIELAVKMPRFDPAIADTAKELLIKKFNDKFELNMKTLEKEQNLTADRLEFFRDRFNTQRQRFDDTVKSWN